MAPSPELEPHEPAEDDVVLRAEQVGKAYPGTTALQGVDFEVCAGTVTVLLGENGAGKSTLMKILAGAERPSSGRLYLDGREVAFDSVNDAAALGIGIIFQELNLCPNLSVAENIFLGHPALRFGIDVDKKRHVAEARKLLSRLEHDIDPEALVGDLRLAEQQIVEIAKALARNVRVLIMDEPTSALSATEVEILFRLIGDLKAAGVGIVYISHRLDEVVRIGDRVTVLRDGQVKARAEMRDVDIPWLIAEMVGRAAAFEPQADPLPLGPPVLEIEEVSLRNPHGGFFVERVSLRLRAGEVVGLYGLLGAGRSELFEILIGAQPDAVGRVRLAGEELAGLPIAARIRRGLALVPEDRQREGLVQCLSVGMNLTLASLHRFLRGTSIDPGQERSAVTQTIRDLLIRVSSPLVEVTALSGGNQQKVVIGKALLTQPKVLLLDEPSRGIDVGARAEVFRTVRRLARDGLGVVFATSDLKEVMAMADRILVMADGRVTGDFPRATVTEEQLVAAANRTAVEARCEEDAR
ncbi:sugar ABC transporter ATP-binding protein [Aliidongia dinghuensis]|uniref:Sugar ABC transporter ATP-binding protein n=1 Tax=Aliidongia dinghuensis TaxID=1867774 RepID=A0A8J2Z114_9PROT|nr:sugar ABC transporter ATP-binding protein [Aliidongia dinghuensis]GGF44912.1 sugar ABC transporter ATP-binding protein [Aliidongia dinghuensis]